MNIENMKKDKESMGNGWDYNNEEKNPIENDILTS